MCGIIAVIGNGDEAEVKRLALRMKHRGPDDAGMKKFDNGYILAHERLSIMDLTEAGRHPIQGTDTAWVIHNGEIYNHNQLRDTEFPDTTFRTTCDSEIIVHLYEKYGYDFANMLDGVFSFVVVDGDDFVAGRDPIGIKPLYYGNDSEGNLYFSSEMKSIVDVCESFEAFPPGYIYTKESGLVKYYNPTWEDHETCTNDLDLTELRDTLIEATKKRLMSDVPLGVLLSGGLDSSLTSAIAARLLKEENGGTLHSFSVGLDPNAPDLKAARLVADFIGTEHHEVHFSVQQGIEALEDIIWHIETYDVTSIRASTPMYFMSKYITDMGVKVVLSGEGADEILGGYLYFHNAPSSEEFQKETIRRVFRLSTADCLRADKSTMAHGLEARVPFLDKKFLDVAMGIDPSQKRPNKNEGLAEKWIVRKAFDTKDDPFLPDEILWRQKEQFSDGVGYNWIDSLIEHCNMHVTDEEMENAASKYPHNTPTTKEAYFYREIFEKKFPGQSAAKTVLKWVPKWQENDDPSGRANTEHSDHEAELAKS